MREQLYPFLLVFAGGGLGSVLRYAVYQIGFALVGTSFPWATLTVNVLGSLAMGLCAGWFNLRTEADHLPRLFLMTGILGGFTTFSAYSLDAVSLWQRGHFAAAALYSLGSVAAGLAGIIVGFAIAKA